MQKLLIIQSPKVVCQPRRLSLQKSRKKDATLSSSSAMCQTRHMPENDETGGFVKTRDSCWNENSSIFLNKTVGDQKKLLVSVSNADQVADQSGEKGVVTFVTDNHLMENELRDPIHMDHCYAIENDLTENEISRLAKPSRSFLKKGSRNARSILPKEPQPSYHYYASPASGLARRRMSLSSPTDFSSKNCEASMKSIFFPHVPRSSSEYPQLWRKTVAQNVRPKEIMDSLDFNKKKEDIDEQISREKKLLEPEFESTSSIPTCEGEEELKEVYVHVNTPWKQSLNKPDADVSSFNPEQRFEKLYKRPNRWNRCDMAKTKKESVSRTASLWCTHSNRLFNPPHNVFYPKDRYSESSFNTNTAIDELLEAFHQKELRYRRLIERLGYQLYLEKTKNLSCTKDTEEKVALEVDDVGVSRSPDSTSTVEGHGKDITELSDSRDETKGPYFSLKDLWEPFENELRRLDTVMKRHGSLSFENCEYSQEMDGNDTVVECISRGWSFRFFHNGDICGVSDQQYTYYHFSKDDVYTIKIPSGVMYNCFSDGQVDCHFPDGTVHVQLPGDSQEKI